MITTELRLGITGMLETALNNYLQLDPQSRSKLSRLEGKVLAVELTGFDITLYLLADKHGIQIMHDYAGEIDATLSGSPLALLGLAMEKNPGPATFANGVKLHGDTELGQRYKHLFDSLDIDWEEHLSRLSGDIVAHKLGNLLRESRQWGQQASNTLQRDVAEYLLQEDHLVPEKSELNHFLNDIDKLREDTDRLEARIKRLTSLATSE